MLIEDLDLKHKLPLHLTLGGATMNFPQEILDIILAHNDQYEIDWRVNQFKRMPEGFGRLTRIRKCFDKRPKWALEDLHDELRATAHAFRKKAVKKKFPEVRFFTHTLQGRWESEWKRTRSVSEEAIEEGRNFCSFKPSKMKLKSIQKELRN